MDRGGVMMRWRMGRRLLGALTLLFGLIAGYCIPQPAEAQIVITEFSAGIASGASPYEITAGPDGNLWFTTVYNPQIRRITPAGVVTEFSAGSSMWNYGITAGPDGNLWFTEQQGNRIGKINPTTGVITEFSAGISANAYPLGITAGPDGNIWFTEHSNGYGSTIGRITPTGVVTEFSNGISYGAGVWGITAGPDGNLWFTELGGVNGNPKIGRITPTGIVAEFSAGLTGRPYSITAGPDGNLWFTEQQGNRIGKINPTTGVITEFSAGISANAYPLGITAGPDGNIWFTEHGIRGIGRITPAGVVTEFSNIITTDNGWTPTHITAGPDGNLWATVDNNNLILRITLGGDVPNPPVLSVLPSSLDFGNVAANGSKDLTFTVTNTGGGTLTGSCTTTAPFSLLNGCSFNLGAGQSQAITVRFSPTSTGTFTGNINITSNGGNTSPSLRGEGSVVATTGNLTVTVRRSDTNTALAGATVALSGGPSSPPSQVTAGDGITTFWNLLAGSYTVSASLAGFQSNSVSTTLVANTGMGIMVPLTPVQSTGTIQVRATLNGAPWFGIVNYTLSGPTSTAGNQFVPVDFLEKPAATWTLTYNSGGPTGASLTNITPSPVQTLSGGSSITFTLSFTTESGRPVVLLHGWGGNGQVGDGGTFGQMKPLLEQHGFAGRVYVYDYSALTSCASTGVGIRQLAGKFQEWLSNNGLHGTQIDVVAHSMGGLVARAYMAGMGIRADGAAVSYGGEIQRLVMIGTPNDGVRAGVFAALASFYGCLPNPLNPHPSSSLSIQAAEQQVGNSFLQTLKSEWQKRQPLAPQNMLVIAGIKGNLAVIFPIPGHLSCLDSTSPEGDDDGVVNVMNAYLPGALRREVPYKHASMIPCPIDGTPQAFIHSSDHLTFAMLVPFLQTGTAPTLYTRRLPGGIWQLVTQLLPFHDIASGVDTQSAGTLTWTEVPGGGLTPVSPAVAAAPNGDVYIVVRGIDNHLYLNIRRNGTWLGWTSHPSGLTGSSPAAVVDVNGNLQVFVRGVDDALYQSTYSGGGWGGWAEVPGGGFTFSAPEAAVNRVTGEITVVVRGIDSQIYLNTFNGAAWSGWSAVPVGGLTLSELGATYDASGTLWLFARGLDAGIWVTSGRGGSWTGWMGLGGTTHSGLAAVASGNMVAVFAHGSNNRIHQNTYANQWSGWNEVPGSGLTLDSPAVTVDSQGNVLLFVRGM